VLFSFLCVVFLIASQVNDDFRKNVSAVFINISLPVAEVVALPFNMTITLVTEFGQLLDAKRENQNLKDELQKLQNFHLKSIDINNENKELKEAFGFAKSKSSTFKVAKVLARSSQVFNQKVFIDAGENKDIKKGQIVTTIHGVVGRVDEVFEEKSRLILVNDATSRIPIMASEARVRGILAGNGSDVMEILYLPEKHNIKIGDLIFTSGDGDTLLSGLFIGSVVKVEADVVFVAMAQDLAAANVVTIVGY
jgi:rod shape-determining protein MreC